MLMKTVLSLMFVSLSGPTLFEGNPTGYVKSWLVKHRGATDTWSRTCKPAPQVEKATPLGGVVIILIILFVGKLVCFYNIQLLIVFFSH